MSNRCAADSAGLYRFGLLICNLIVILAECVSCRMLAVGPNKLLLAASVGEHEEIRRLMEEEGLSPCHIFPRGVTALHEACEAGHVEVAKLLLDSGADVNKQVAI